ncbi:MAG: hypothetical protein L6V79_04640 [Clostridium sp.]|nr:MAG: hypothetical protein L6V79_04640 [Clostridium sp.]
MTEKISRHLLNTVNTFSDEKIGVIVYLSRKNALNGFEIVKEYPFINAVGVKIAAHELNRLASFKSVKFVTSSSKVFRAFGRERRKRNVGFSKQVFDDGERRRNCDSRHGRIAAYRFLPARKQTFGF